MDTTVITGSSGKAGRTAVRHFIDHGFNVLGVDRTRPERPDAPTLLADLTNPNEAWEAIKGARYVVHLANIPAPGIHPETRTFMENLSMNYAVFRAAADAQVERVTWASSETTL
ncbi:MAG TPA: NAD(P)-dependent oxidoreductase, partial [Deinococcales bacterium]|nr:NAD(P)-dependent oxidoreductase [Deinococcales bacterium]